MRRPILMLAAAMLSCLGLAAAPAASEIYRWVDAAGKSHFANDLDSVPAEYRDAARAGAGTESEGGAVVRYGTPQPSPDAEPASPDPLPAALEKEPETRGGHDEWWWRDEALSREHRIEVLEGEIERAREREEQTAQIYYVPGTWRGKGVHERRRHPRAVVVGDDRGEDGPSVEELEADLENAERDLEDFEDLARRTSVPPGWLR